MGQIQVEVDDQPDCVVVRLSGEVSVPNAGAFEMQITRLSAYHSRPRVIFDLSGLTYMCSLAMGQLVAYHRAMARHKSRFRIVGLSGPIREALQHARLTDVLQIRDSLDAARAD